ncbi:putative peptidase M24B family protein [Lyophyllum shimeji]|uniref:Peptidase M24B family protein n=1 Tax=Lyophyllum shimeji TaxID=47721 RepID=A0A9P3UUR3_LYOSH|nr:putative peptidase M24B family protein [Lyophyllum shimeji]
MAPPPPPICFPFVGGSKPKRRLSWSSGSRASQDNMIRHPSYSPTSTLTDAAESLTFHSDSEKYDEVPKTLPELHTDSKGRPKLTRSNTMTGTKKSTASSKWGYGWGVGKKQKEKEAEAEAEKGEGSGHSTSQTPLPVYQPPTSPPTRSNTKSSHASKSSQRSHDSHKSEPNGLARAIDSLKRGDSQRSHVSHASQATHASHSSRSTRRSEAQRTATHGSSQRPQLYPNDSQSTLVGSALERKMAEVDSIRDYGDTAERLEDLRRNMATHALDYYIIPSEDAHGSEYVAESDQRRQFISGFYGTAGQAIVTMSSAYLFTDSRYWLQAKEQLDRNWTLIKAGGVGEPKDWIEWLVNRAKDARIGIDARMISHEKAMLINDKISQTNSKLVYPPQNLVDLVWKDKPPKSKAPVFLHPIEFAGVSAATKLVKLREWIRAQPPSIPSYSKGPATPDQVQTGTLISSLACIAYLLNIRGSDIPHNPLFHAYLYVGLESATIFLDASKVTVDTGEYLKSLGVERREYLDLWSFLRRREWGKGKILISPQTSYAISLMLTHYRYTVAPNWIEHTMAVKNETELEGLRRAYLRDGASFVRFLAWLEAKLNDGYDITEYEAASRLTEFRRHNKNFMGIAYKSISASGPNAALPHYTPRKSTARMIDRETPYLNDSGGQYRDGTCDTTRTVHFGRPSAEQCEAFTRVLQGHIAIDSAIFPEGTSGHQLDVLARKALWRDGLNYMHGTGHGFGSFLTVHEGPQSFSSNVPLVPGHVITNEPGFYNEGKWGMRIESALAVRRVKTRGDFNGNIWLGFERLTCVPVQTRMVKESMLTKEEKTWLKEHNQRCLEKLTPLLKDDKRAMKWLKREAERGIGLATGPGGMNIEWD